MKFYYQCQMDTILAIPVAGSHEPPNVKTAARDCRAESGCSEPVCVKERGFWSLNGSKDNEGRKELDDPNCRRGKNGPTSPVVDRDREDRE